MIPETSSDEDAFHGDKEDGLAEWSEDDAASDLEDDFESFDSESDENPPSQPQTRRKENPYVAPTSQGRSKTFEIHPSFFAEVLL